MNHGCLIPIFISHSATMEKRLLGTMTLVTTGIPIPGGHPGRRCKGMICVFAIAYSPYKPEASSYHRSFMQGLCSPNNRGRLGRRSTLRCGEFN
jgi:hypothetical protein